MREYLDGLKWDGEQRLDTWLMAFAGAEDSILTRAIGAKVLLAAVRRVRKPGCKFDQCLVLEGPQGAGKSSLVRILAGEDRFTDCLHIGAEAKVIIEQTAGSWLVEMAELSGIRRGEVEPIKAMISRQVDRARAAATHLVHHVVLADPVRRARQGLHRQGLRLDVRMHG